MRSILNLSEGSHLAKPNYSFAKRQRDLAKQQKREEKRKKKSERNETPPPAATDPQVSKSESHDS
jgi:ATPase subunit of ABC transporter with duplicated ATPase domains